MVCRWSALKFPIRGINISDSQTNPLKTSDPALLWASFFGVGYLKPAPGTWGSVAALVVWWFAIAPLNLEWQLGIIVVYFLSGWWASSVITRRYHIDDASQIVADEVVGMWLALLLLPHIWWVALLALLLFRALDIAKPGLIGWLDRELKGGLGVMADDVIAGLAAGGLIWALLVSLPFEAY